MKTQKVQEISYKNTESNMPTKKHEFIDTISNSVMNPRDVNDMIAVPRGIFKAYIFIMTGSALLALSSLIKGKKPFGKAAKTSIATVGWIFNMLSAIFFAKPYAFKGLSPTVKREDINK